MTKGKFSGPMTAEELMAKLQADPEWVAANREREKKRAERDRFLDENEAPIISDLESNGIKITSICNLSIRDYPEAIPILLKHLQLFNTYDQRIRGGMADALATEKAKQIVPHLLDIYRRDPDQSLNIGKGAIANTICELADEGYVDEIAALVLDQEHGAARAPFIDFLGESKSDVSKAALERVRDDPYIDVSLRARSMLEKMNRRQSKGAMRHRRKNYKLIANIAATFGRGGSAGNDGSVEFNRPFLMRKVHRGFLESSGSFDGDKLPEFLRLVERAGLVQEVVSKAVLTELTEMDISEERLLEFKVEFKGRMRPLQVLLYLEDTDAPSVYFFSTHELTSAIDRVMGEWMDAE